jgi:TonB family protein
MSSRWVLSLVVTLSWSACAQQLPCRNLSIPESRMAAYPELARKGHVQGPVNLVVHFKPSGRVSDVQVIDGQRMLQQSAASFVRGWRTESDKSPCTCEVTLTYHLRQPEEPKVPAFVRTGPQTGTITADAPPIETLY